MPADSSPATVFVDADNTLWDTDAVFARAQLGLLASIEQATGSGSIAVERLPFIREIDQQLAQRHHNGLRYPPRLLARAAAFALMGFPAARAAKAAWLGEIRAPLDETLEARLEQAFFAEISAPPELRPGVIEGLDSLLESCCAVLIVTESAQAKVAATAEQWGSRGTSRGSSKARSGPNSISGSCGLLTCQHVGSWSATSSTVTSLPPRRPDLRLSTSRVDLSRAGCPTRQRSNPISRSRASLKSRRLSSVRFKRADLTGRSFDKDKA